jgi:hypothetical protein
MAAFNSEEAARQGRSETIPAGWTKYAVSRGALWLNVLSYGGCGLILAGAALYLLLSGAAQTTSIVEFGALVILAFIFLLIGLRLIPPLRNQASHFFLITPDGFVQVAGQKISGLPFSEISAARREPGLLGAKLVVQQRSSKTLVLPIGRLYGAGTLREIEETLTAGITPDGQGKLRKARRR